MRRAFLFLPLILLALGCDRRCDELHAREIDGRFTIHPAYLQEATGPSGGKMVSAQVDTGEGRVVFTYELADGSRYRATYRVKSERKVP